MRRTTLFFAVLTLAGLVLVEQASASGWNARWRTVRSVDCCCATSATTVEQEAPAPAERATPTATVATQSRANSHSAKKGDDAALLSRLLSVMEEILELENERLDRSFEHYEWLEKHGD